jgi:hypothetical protein
VEDVLAIALSWPSGLRFVREYTWGPSMDDTGTKIKKACDSTIEDAVEARFRFCELIGTARNHKWAGHIVPKNA